jgi:hypothetical protein
LLFEPCIALGFYYSNPRDAPELLAVTYAVSEDALNLGFGLRCIKSRQIPLTDLAAIATIPQKPVFNTIMEDTLYQRAYKKTLPSREQNTDNLVIYRGLNTSAAIIRVLYSP